LGGLVSPEETFSIPHSHCTGAAWCCSGQLRLVQSCWSSEHLFLHQVSSIITSVVITTLHAVKLLFHQSFMHACIYGITAEFQTVCHVNSVACRGCCGYGLLCWLAMLSQFNKVCACCNLPPILHTYSNRLPQRVVLSQTSLLGRKKNSRPF